MKTLEGLKRRDRSGTATVCRCSKRPHKAKDGETLWNWPVKFSLSQNSPGQRVIQMSTLNDFLIFSSSKLNAAEPLFKDPCRNQGAGSLARGLFTEIKGKALKKKWFPKRGSLSPGVFLCWVMFKKKPLGEPQLFCYNIMAWVKVVDSWNTEGQGQGATKAPGGGKGGNAPFFHWAILANVWLFCGFYLQQKLNWEQTHQRLLLGIFKLYV